MRQASLVEVANFVFLDAKADTDSGSGRLSHRARRQSVSHLWRNGMFAIVEHIFSFRRRISRSDSSSRRNSGPMIAPMGGSERRDRSTDHADAARGLDAFAARAGLF
jgi:hypothetical protein